MGNRVAVLTRPGEIVLEDRPMPEPGPRDVLVEITSVGVCGSDVHWFEHGRIGSRVVTGPLVLGHESAGRVTAVGPEVTRHKVGDRVTLEPGVPCGRCRECRHGRYNLCPDVVFFATPPIDGAFANFVTIHEDFAFALPDELSDDVGALMEPLSVGIWACRKANVTAADRVLVTGAGPIGLIAMQVALAFGATQVEISDINRDRLAVAERTGATRALVAGEDEPAEADVLIECSGNERAMSAGIEALRPAGTAVMVGMGPGATAELPLALIQTSEIWLTGTFRYANTYPTAIALAAAGRVDLESLITGHYGLDDTLAALKIGGEDPDEREGDGASVSVLDAFRLDGKVAVVTGGNRGLGQAFARALGEAGARVAIAVRDEARSEAVAGELGALAVRTDVTDPSSVEAMVETVTAELGPIDVLVNNSGVCFHRPALEVPAEEWRAVWDVNVDGVWHCCRAVGAQMLQRGTGAIVNIGSISAMIVNRPQMQPAYNASKAAVHQLTKSLAAEWAP